MKVYSDAAKRIAAEMTLYALAHDAGWAVFSLSDGTPARHFAYPRREDAVRDMHWDRDNYLYLEVQPDGMSPREAEAVLKYGRALHDAGFRIPEPDFNFDASMPLLKSDRARQIRHLASGGKN